MAEYSPGMRVIIRDEEWMVKKVDTNSLERKAIHCVGISKLVKDHQAIFLTDLEDIEPVDPAQVKLVIDDSPFFRKSRLYIESQWRQQTPTDAALHIGNKAAMDVMNFQLEPAQIALRRPRQRLLIADTVGLGKTLEAGILMAELIARGRGKRILVVTVKSMMTQFQKEMWNRFTIPLVRLDSNKIQKIRAQLPSNYNPFFYYDKTIVSIDTLKRDIEYRTHLENSWWDIIVIDEAHNVAVRGSQQAQRSRLAHLLAGRSDTLILLSATPHDGRAESFASLMNMLDPTAIANPYDYRKEDIKGLCIRRFKQDVKDQVQGAFQERRVTIEHCQASAAEEEAFAVFSAMELIMDTGKQHIAGQLFKTSLEKALFSSPAACSKSIDERLQKLRKKHGTTGFSDITHLEELKAALRRIEPTSFSRYQQLLGLLRRADYGWNVNNSNDRIVIFTERIETMRFLAANLRRDLQLSDKTVQELFGGMSDSEQQTIVDDFGRTESPIRILVASDVAAEGINLHYLSHRLIHFDIPWSLMVFQQRNGRIDRYGQQQQPDIRYLMIRSTNEKIKGDTRIMEILIRKEEQAYTNIGDPTLLLGKFNIADEELVTAAAIEQGASADDFSKSLDESAAEFDPFELLMAGAAAGEAPAQVCTDETLYTDSEYLASALSYFATTTRQTVTQLQTVAGLEIELTPELKRRLAALVPEEALPGADFLRLSSDKSFCMAEMKRSMQNNMDETAWPSTQYLWKNHPIFEWVNDKAGLLFGRAEAPLIVLDGPIPPTDTIFVIAGMIPNRKSTPVVDEWFGLRFSGAAFRDELTLEQVISLTGFGRRDLPNRNNAPLQYVADAAALLPSAVAAAQTVLARHCASYREKIEPQITEELEKLIILETKHKEYHLSLVDNERKKSEQERKVERIFSEFTDWVKDTLEIENNPYLRIVAVLKGV